MTWLWITLGIVGGALSATVLIGWLVVTVAGKALGRALYELTHIN